MPRRALAWLRIFAVAGLVGLVAGVVVASCAVPDGEYCMVNSQCSSIATELGMVQLTCHATRHVCVGQGGEGSCTSDDSCSDYRTPRCDDGTCTSCKVGDSSDTSCAQRKDGRTRCANALDGSGTRCVACEINKHCPAETPICDNQACRACNAHQDCEGELRCETDVTPCTDSLVCIQDGDLTPDLVGRCARNGPTMNGRVIYVNGAVPDPEGKTNPGTDFSTAVNNLHRAMDLARDQGRRYIRLAGNLSDAPGMETAYVIKDTAVSFIGAPIKKSANPTAMATITGRSTLFQLVGGTMAFDQVTMMQNSANQNSVICSAGNPPGIPNLIIRRSIFSGSTPPNTPMAYGPVITTTNCNATIDGNIIGVTNFNDLNTTAPVNGTAITLSDNTVVAGTTVLIQNNVIAGNAGNALDLGATGKSKGKFILRFNTIVKNGRGQMGTANSIYCPNVASSQEFSSSIVVGNSQQSGTQFNQGPTCNLKDVVVGTAEMGTNLGGVIAKDPVLSPDFRLRPGPENNACCIDKIPAASSLPKTDVDGISRPQGIGTDPKWDIGASEYKP